MAYGVKALTIPPPRHPQNIQAPSMQAIEGVAIDSLTIEKIVEEVLTKLSN